jgi:hypothetical protein
VAKIVGDYLRYGCRIKEENLARSGGKELGYNPSKVVVTIRMSFCRPLLNAIT